VMVDGAVVASASGRKKKEAEQEAARLALASVRDQTDGPP